MGGAWLSPLAGRTPTPLELSCLTRLCEEMGGGLWASLGSPSCGPGLHGQRCLDEAWEQPAHPWGAACPPPCRTPNLTPGAPPCCVPHGSPRQADSRGPGGPVTPAHPPTHTTRPRQTGKLRAARVYSVPLTSPDQSVSQSIKGEQNPITATTPCAPRKGVRPGLLQINEPAWKWGEMYSAQTLARRLGGCAPINSGSSHPRESKQLP